ncbi:MAG TPA: SAM-dependent methyltransferase [Methylocella sp.]|nr:SAM-dependent methyltransferase [Methylocella sp.]
MTPLEQFIREMILAEGPISVETFMSLALNHPVHGYYASRIPLGAEGDFITAPEISQMFGELIGLWCAAVWQAMGKPRTFRLAELGPGRGTLMADALRAARAVPEFSSALDVHLVETSAVLQEAQRKKLSGFGRPISWHKTIDSLPHGPAIVIANEFFDCLPVRHFIRQADGWHERVIGLGQENHLCFGLAPEPVLGLDTPGAAGEVIEAGFAAARLMTELAARISSGGGAALIIDYGYDRPARGETLQAVRSHRFDDPLREPGEADLTAHVDFCALSSAARTAGADVYGPVQQGIWLTRLGIYERAAALKKNANGRERVAIDEALLRLAGREAGSPADMARLFKVLAVTQKGLGAPPGFETAPG